MYSQIAAILQFMLQQLIATWPYLLITIPLAVAVKLSGASRFITRALSARPLPAIVLATAVGAFSPFCSCSVIPVVATLLIGGVPLAPVMAFWIASPSMDPEIFFLSVSALGWELALWRLGSTLVLSLAAGLITYYLMRRGWLGSSILRLQRDSPTPFAQRVRRQWTYSMEWLRSRFALAPRPALVLAGAEACAAPDCTAPAQAAAFPVLPASQAQLSAGCGAPSACDAATGCDANACAEQGSFRQRLLAETWSAVVMVVKFMLLAYFLEALIALYVPQDWIVATLGADQPFVIALAALLGVPIYTSNLAAMPLIGGLLAQGMSPAAALAFLIAGPTTTLPAMAAVSGLVTRRVFILYVAFALFGAMAAGYAYQLAHWLH